MQSARISKARTWSSTWPRPRTPYAWPIRERPRRQCRRHAQHAARGEGRRRPPLRPCLDGISYGEPLELPTDENSALRPVSYYGVSKLAGEAYALLFNTLHGLDTVVLRYFHVYGPRQDNSDVGGVVSIFCRRAHEGRDLVIYGDGTQVRSFTYVGDVVNINLLAAVEQRMVGRPFNCASGVRVTIRELAEKVLASYRREDLAIEYRDWKPGDIRNFQVDNRRLRSNWVSRSRRTSTRVSKQR